ncbi:MAG: CHRD domain-containing protein [Gammaproteobacteria bacterium]
MTRYLLRGLVLASFLCTASAQAAIFEFGALLSGAQEVPAVATPGNGSALVLFDSASKELVWNLSFRDLLAPVNTAGSGPTAHIHEAPAGSNGPVKIFIDSTNPGTLVSGEGKSEGIFAGAAVIDAALESALFAGNLYFNLHTPASTSGEIRGQILPASVTVVPLPGALLLLGPALGGMLLCHRRVA